MKASERLQAIIRERQDWETFGWGPVLVGWTVALVAKAVVELWTGPRLDVGTAALLVALGVQGLVAAIPGASRGVRQLPMHGLWALVALSAWFVGSWAPAVGLIGGPGATVLGLMFFAGGLGTTGFLKARQALVVAGASLAAGAVVLGVFPVLAPGQGLLLAGTFGGASLASLRSDRSSLNRI